MRILISVAVLLIAPVLAAQRTYVLDASGGGDFTQFYEAWTALRDGDRLLVAPGRYVEPVRNMPSKAVEILGIGATPTAAVIASGRLHFWSLPAGRFVLSNLTLEGYLEVSLHAGPVLIHDVSAEGMGFSQCPNVLLQDVDCDSPYSGTGLSVAHSVASVNGANIVGCSCPDGYPYPGTYVSSGTAVIDASTTTGGDSIRFSDISGASGAILRDSTVSATATAFRGGLSRNGTRRSAVRSYGQNDFQYDRCQFEGSVSVVTNTAVSMPGLRGDAHVARGAVARYELSGAPGRSALLVFALDVAPWTAPVLSTPFWLANPTSIPIGALTIGKDGAAPYTLPIPNHAGLENLFFFLQGVGWLGDARVRSTSVVATRIR